MARFVSFVVLLATMVAVLSGRALAAEPIAGAVDTHRAPTASEVQLSQYLYVDFPRYVQALDNERQLADAELKFVQSRVDGYRPFRSFKQYGATYTADQAWQLALLAAQQRQQELQDIEAELWRQRRYAAEHAVILGRQRK